MLSNPETEQKEKKKGKEKKKFIEFAIPFPFDI